MRFTTTREGETLEDLTERIYAGKDAKASDRRAAAKALAAANPFLRRLRDVPEGTVLTVPPLEQVDVSERATDELGPLGVGAMLDQVRGAVAEATAQLDADLEVEVEASRETIRLAGDPGLKKAAREDPDLGEVAKATAAAAQERVEDARALRRFQREALAQIERDADELLETLGGKRRRPSSEAARR